MYCRLDWIKVSSIDDQREVKRLVRIYFLVFVFKFIVAMRFTAKFTGTDSIAILF